MERIGLFGGSFDPVHLGHLLVAQSAFEELQLSRVAFIPASQSPFKPDSAPAPPAHRLQMLRLALSGQSHCEVDDQEVRRGGVSYTVDTARNYSARFPRARLFCLIGADQATQLHLWRESTELADLVEFVIISRSGEGLIQAPPPFRSRPLAGFPFGVSSSQVRDRVRKRLPIDLLVPAAVAEAIANNRLYL